MTSATEQASADSSIAPGLDEWLYGENTDSRSLIVEVKLPQRRVVFGEAQSDQRRLPRGLVSKDPEARRRTIQALAAYLRDELGLSAKVLETAAAVVVTASPAQARRLAEHALTKRIRLNRPLSPKRTA